MDLLRIESLRGSHVESTHRVSAAIVDSAGRLVAHAGNPEFPTFLRSAAKPFQALPLVQDGVVDRFAMSDEELALCCASHNSEAYQVEKVRALLDRIGCVEADLVCGPHRSLAREMTLKEEPETRDPRHEIVKPSPLASNCSGKHTGMLALARHHGWESRGYHLSTHPVQQRCLNDLAQWSGVDAAAIDLAVDGCGVVCFRIPLRAMALAFARLGHGTGAPERAIVRAMTAHPDLVAGRGRLCTEIMQAYPGKLLAKVGAEGVYGAVLLERDLGVAVKVEDGSSWAAMVAFLAILDALKLDPLPTRAFPGFAAPPTVNTRGETVGILRVSGTLTFD